MKCINKTKGKKWKEIRRKKLRKTGMLIGGFVVLLVLVITGLTVFMRSKALDEPVPYERSSRTFLSASREISMSVEGMAAGLCVGESQTAMDGITSQEGELAALFDIKKGEIPFSNGLYEKTAPGKLTQLMTALVAWENMDMDTQVTVEQEDFAYGKGSRTCGLAAGNIIPARQLLNAVLVYSAQDASLVLARACSSSRDSFVAAMNSKAVELGMTNTHFTNVTGAEDEEQYTTVYDVYLLLNALLNEPDLTNAMGLANYTLDYSKASGDSKQQWLDSDNLYITGAVSVPKDVTVLGGKMSVSSDQNYGALLVQNNYGDAFMAVVLKTDGQVNLYERLQQMLEKINS